MEGRLEIIKTKIERMGKKHHVEVLKILKGNSQIKINENKSGVFINLSYLPVDTVLKLEEYIESIQEQEKTLETVETQKENFKHTFFTN
jgi:hypothetical protein